MPSTPLTRSESRQRFAELRAIVNSWDPIGVMADSDWPRDEYDCIVGPLLRLLESGEGEGAIAAFLQGETTEHFGLSTKKHDLVVLARECRLWFERGWAELADPITIYVALLDEGVDVWRPVQARPLPGGLYRIIGLDPMPDDERWQFPSGATVRCEERTFSGSTTQLVAMALSLSDVAMSPIERIREKLASYPGVVFTTTEDRLEVQPADDNGFVLRFQTSGKEFVVSFDGWHERFANEDEALRCFAFGLSDSCSLLVTLRGRFAVRWRVETLENGSWTPDSETGLLLSPFWLPKREVRLRNHHLKSTQ